MDCVGNVVRGHIGQTRGKGSRSNTADTAAHHKPRVPLNLFHASHGGPYHESHTALFVIQRRCEIGVGKGFLSCSDEKLGAASHAPGRFHGYVVLRLEILDLRRDTTGVLTGIEASHRPYT
jgi:hypothetical protein